MPHLNAEGKIPICPVCKKRPCARKGGNKEKGRTYRGRCNPCRQAAPGVEPPTSPRGAGPVERKITDGPKKTYLIMSNGKLPDQIRGIKREDPPKVKRPHFHKPGQRTCELC